jgi:hypothetical protein
MSPRQASRYYSVSKRWLALVERRKQHFIDLCDSGRWKFYFDTEDELREQMRKVIMLRLRWVRLVDDMSAGASDLDPGVASDLDALAQADLAEVGLSKIDLARPGLGHADSEQADLAQADLARAESTQADLTPADEDQALVAA